jgi:hypothetical protein
MRSPTRAAADEIGMRCKSLFYFSRRSLVFGRCLARHSVIPNAVEGPCVDPDQRPMTNDERPTLPRTIPMHHLHPIPRRPQPFRDILSNHDRPVLPTRAAKRNRQITLALTDVMRQQVDQQL